jgi:hypothetical protein
MPNPNRSNDLNSASPPKARIHFILPAVAHRQQVATQKTASKPTFQKQK